MSQDQTEQPPELLKEAVLKSSSESYCATFKKVRGYSFEDRDGRPCLDYEELLNSYMTTGLQATQLGRAINIVHQMLSERKKPFQPDTGIEDEFIRPRTNCTIFLAYTSNMISSGMREQIRFLVKNKLVDCIVTTAGGIEEDLIKCLKLENDSSADTYVADFGLPGANMREEGMNGVGNLIVPNNNYRSFEDWLMPILTRMTNEQVDSKGKLTWSPSTMIERLGFELNHTDSVCYWAAKNKIPIFCPGLTDGSLGDMIHLHFFRNPNFILNIASDVHRLNTFAHYTVNNKTGVIILGGGLAKHHTLNANLMRNGADYAVYVNTSAEFDGSDSGAEPNEAVSWGKLKPDAVSAKVTCEASLVFPLLIAKTFFPYANKRE